MVAMIEKIKEALGDMGDTKDLEESGLNIRDKAHIERMEDVRNICLYS